MMNFKTSKYRTFIDRENVKVLAINSEGSHMELPFDYSKMQECDKNGWKIYATNNEGVFFFINNREEDGNDWCKITKL